MWMLNFNCFPHCSLVYTPISSFEEIVDLPPFWHLISQNLKNFTNQMGAKNDLIAVLICTSLMTDDVEHLFIFLWILSVSCSVKCFTSFIHFFLFFSFGLLVLFILSRSCFYVFLIHYLAVPGLSCSMWDIVPWSEVKPRPPALGVWHLSHWTIMEVSVFMYF